MLAPIAALAMGHMASNMLRTLPAVMADELMLALSVGPEVLAIITGAYHWSFALMQVPIGVALDRFGVRRTALVLMSVGLVGALLAASARGPSLMLLAQILMGAGTAGALLCPMTYAARALDPVRFGLWSGIVLGIGNSGMLISATPAAWLTEAAGWRAGFLGGAAVEAAALLAVLTFVPRDAPAASTRSLGEDAREVRELFFSPLLRAPIVIAFVSFAATVMVRGLWGGPWLMEAGLDRIAAGNVLLGMTIGLTVGPFVAGALDRRVGRRVVFVTAGHMLAGVAMIVALLVPAAALPLLALAGLTVSSQAMVFALTRAAVAPERAGRALSALNLAFFLGAALLQPLSGLAAAAGGPAAGVFFAGAVLILGAVVFVVLSRR